MRTPEISVVMSVYNGSKYLDLSVESILAQERSDFEFIIVNDGSTDETPEILEEYSKKDKRIRIIQQGNQGLTRSLINGCTVARGDYVARQDADDISHPQRLTKQLSLIRSDPKYQFVSCWVKYIGPGGELIDEVRRPVDSHEATQGLIYNKMGPPAHGSVMFRKDAYDMIGGYRIEFYYGQDADLWLRLSMQGQVSYVPEFLYSFRLHTDSVSGTSRELQNQFGEIGQACHTARLNGESEAALLDGAMRLRNQINSNAKEKTSQSNIAATSYFIGSCLLKRGDRRAARYFWDTIKITPCNFKAWMRLVNSLLHDMLKIV